MSRRKGPVSRKDDYSGSNKNALMAAVEAIEAMQKVRRAGTQGAEK